MKKLIFSLLATILIFSAFSQTSTIKNYPLKDYIAPEIKYRTLGLGSGLNSGGYNEFSDNNENSIRLNAGLNYFEYINTSRHQGISNAYAATFFSSQVSNKDSIKNSISHIVANLSYNTQNRFYYTSKNFAGIHGNLSYSAYPLNKRSGEYNYKSQQHNFIFTPYISIGKGRIQPIENARRAMDILISLEANKCLAQAPNVQVIDSLAHVANRIRYKRFFDNRFKNIYQLEELDRAIQDMGLVDSVDIVYFANLNDIWNFAPDFNRGSGTRIEGGIIPDILLQYHKYDDSDIPRLSTGNFNQYGIYGFVSFNRMHPMNYTWQSDLMIDLTFGYKKDKDKYEDDNDEHESTSEALNSILNASWQFGYFPNTRTFAGITPYVGVSNRHNFESETNKFGINTGVEFNMYYYVSPRLRFAFQANISYYDSFAFEAPTPFWNTVSFSSREANLLRKMNDVVAFPVDAFRYNSNSKELSYSALISLNYAIF